MNSDIPSASFISSDLTDKLDAALAKAQGEIENAAKDAFNPHFKSNYSDLASVWNACRGPLSKHGISVTQWPTHSDLRSVTLMTRVAHAGQWMQSTMTMPTDKPTAQGIGSALTYARRYMLSAVAGVAPNDDDDGNAASGKEWRDEGLAEAPRNPELVIPPKGSTDKIVIGGSKPKASDLKAKFTDEQESKVASMKLASDAQLKLLHTIKTKQGWTDEQLKLYMEYKWKLISTRQLTLEQYDIVVEAIQSGPYQKAMTADFGNSDVRL